MNKKIFTVAVAGLAAISAFAESEDYQGRWSFSIGPAWRSRVKMETKCSHVTPAPTPSSTTKRDMTDSDNWTDAALVDDPLAGTGGIPADAQLWGVDDVRTEVYANGATSISANGSDEDRPLGLNLQGCYDFYQGETLSIGLNLRFAGYWNMKSSSRGVYSSITQTDVYTDHYIFPDLFPGGTFDPDPADSIVANGSTKEDALSKTDVSGVGAVSSRFRGDLYQIGLGPKVTWSPFATSETFLSRFSVYGGVEALCNISYAKLNTTGASGSSTDCLLGFGGNVGLVGDITESLGIFGQVGYEWVDKTDIKTGGFKSEIDYSSLVISAGLQYRF